jgi:cell division protein FtsI/penicillin-binding protein 2
MVTKEMTPGGSVVLTIDLDIQAITEEELQKAVENAKAAGGAAIVMDPQTGEVLALASQPSFDPNTYFKFPQENWAPHSIVSPYEPGSTFKVITVSAAMEEKLLADNWTYHCAGSQAVGRRRVNCAQHGGTSAHGTLTLDEVIIESCNSGAAAIAMKLGKDRLYHWVKEFGFGEQTGIELAGETAGIVWNPKTWSTMQLANIGFGQGISVTPLQLLSAYCAIANGGYRVYPRVVKAKMGPEGQLQQLELPKRKRILSAETSERMRHAMTEVVESEKGTGSNARILDRTTAGKTGTAQKPTPEAGFKSGLYIGSFCGFAPAKDPKLAIIVVIDEPHNGYYGGVVAAPAFREIASRALTQLGVPPDREKTELGNSVRVAQAHTAD